MAGKARVSALAKELGVTSKDVLAKLSEFGEYVKGPSSTVEAPVERRLREAFPAPAEGVPAKKAPARKAAAKAVPEPPAPVVEVVAPVIVAPAAELAAPEPIAVAPPIAAAAAAPGCARDRSSSGGAARSPSWQQPVRRRWFLAQHPSAGRPAGRVARHDTASERSRGSASRYPTSGRYRRSRWPAPEPGHDARPSQPRHDARPSRSGSSGRTGRSPWWPGRSWGPWWTGRFWGPRWPRWSAWRSRCSSGCSRRRWRLSRRSGWCSRRRWWFP